MTQATSNPMLTQDNGVAFTVVTADFVQRDCVISKEALAALSPHSHDAFGPMEIFRANEPKIRGVARRLIAANVQGIPLQLEPRSFH